ncbi:hypothetical protein LY78DRAFT_452704 [Colletotrichum sublineola]|nr:hypothetical protein LY78DRAFT_452704 [Colletotrichum sublineola]
MALWTLVMGPWPSGPVGRRQWLRASHCAPCPVPAWWTPNRVSTGGEGGPKTEKEEDMDSSGTKHTATMLDCDEDHDDNHDHDHDYWRVGAWQKPRWQTVVAAWQPAWIPDTRPPGPSRSRCWRGIYLRSTYLQGGVAIDHEAEWGGRTPRNGCPWAAKVRNRQCYLPLCTAACACQGLE